MSPKNQSVLRRHSFCVLLQLQTGLRKIYLKRIHEIDTFATFFFFFKLFLFFK